MCCPANITVEDCSASVPLKDLKMCSLRTCAEGIDYERQMNNCNDSHVYASFDCSTRQSIYK